MGTRQPTRLTATAYGLPEDAVAGADSGDAGAARTGMFVLFALVIALAVATLWYVARPALEQKPTVERSCEVIILRSGSPSCVSAPMRAAHASLAASKRSSKR
jgi:hypothetical protein